MDKNEEIRIKILNREKYLGRPCTEEEKKDGVADTEFEWSRRKVGKITPKITKEEFLQIVKEEGLSEYVKVEINSYECSGEYCALINKIEEYYTLLATGERARITINSVFATPEELYYRLLKYMKKVKNEFIKYNYKPHEKKHINTGEDRKLETARKIDAIVYTSNTGYTKEYALLLAKETGLIASSLAEAKNSLARGSNIIYLGWVMASTVKEYTAAAKLYNVLAVVGVCLGTTGSQIEEIRKMQSIPESTPLFTLQGGFDMERLRGIYKLMMKMMRKFLKKQIGEKQAQTADDKRIVDMLDNGGSAVCAENLSKLISWYQES